MLHDDKALSTWFEETIEPIKVDDKSKKNNPVFKANPRLASSLQSLQKAKKPRQSEMRKDWEKQKDMYRKEAVNNIDKRRIAEANRR